MGIVQFIILLIVVAVIYSSVIGYIYFKDEITAFLSGGNKKKKTKSSAAVVSANALLGEPKRSLVGEVKRDDTAFTPKVVEAQEVPKTVEVGRSVPVSSQETANEPLADNSFSISEIEKAMNAISKGIEDNSETLEADSDIFSQISSNGSIDVEHNKEGKLNLVSMTALENSIVF